MPIVKSISCGEGDTYYIKHGTSNFTIIDCCLCDEDKERIVDEIIEQARFKDVTRFISTHPDEDHFLGIDYLDSRMNILNFYCVQNQATKAVETVDFLKCKELRDSNKAYYIYNGCTRRWMNLDGPDNNGKEIKNSGMSVLWPVTNNKCYMEELQKAKEGKSYNNISAIIKYDCGPTFLWMGDMETGMMENIKDSLEIGKINILFAPHHGRDTGKVPKDLLKKINPDIIIVGEAASQHLHYYPDYNKITQNSAGDITFECVSNKVHIYVGNEMYQVDYLENQGMVNFNNYIGTLNCN